MKKLLLAAAVIASLASCSENKKTENPAPASAVKRETGTATISGRIFAKAALPFKSNGTIDTISLDRNGASVADTKSRYLDTLTNSSIPLTRLVNIMAAGSSENPVTVIAYVDNVDINLTNTTSSATENNGVTKVTGTVTSSSDGLTYSVTVPAGTKPTMVTIRLGDIERQITIPAKFVEGSTTEVSNITLNTRHVNRTESTNQLTVVRGESYLFNINYDGVELVNKK